MHSRLAELQAAIAHSEDTQQTRVDMKRSSSGGGASGRGGKSKSAKKVVVKRRGVVAHESGLAEDAHVLKDAKGGELYHITLNKSELSSGRNSFHLLQVLKHDSKKSWFVVRQWGRVGHRGQTKVETFRAPHTAIRRFKELYQMHTGGENEWGGPFAKQPGLLSAVSLLNPS